jgi:hypothetical protein
MALIRATRRLECLTQILELRMIPAKPFQYTGAFMIERLIEWMNHFFTGRLRL